MTIQFSVSTSSRSQAGAIGVPVGTDGPVSPKIGLNRKQLAERGFDGRVGQTLVLHGLGGASVVVAIGVGAGNSLTPNDARKAAAAFARAAGKVESLSTTLANLGRGSKSNIAQAVVEGIQLATHRYSALKSDKNFASPLREVVLVATAANATAISRGVKDGAVIANAVCTARDFANMPPAYLTARHFAEKAQEIAAQTGLDITVYNKEELIQMGCGGIIGVNQGSIEPPRMVKLSYNPKGAGKKQQQCSQRQAAQQCSGHDVFHYFLMVFSNAPSFCGGTSLAKLVSSLLNFRQVRSTPCKN